MPEEEEKGQVGRIKREGKKINFYSSWIQTITATPRSNEKVDVQTTMPTGGLLL